MLAISLNYTPERLIYYYFFLSMLGSIKSNNSRQELAQISIVSVIGVDINIGSGRGAIGITFMKLQPVQTKGNEMRFK